MSDDKRVVDIKEAYRERSRKPTLNNVTDLEEFAISARRRHQKAPEPEIKKTKIPKRIALLGISTLLVALSFTQYYRPAPIGNQQQLRNNTQNTELNGETDIMTLGTGKEDILYYPQPKIGFTASRFCTGFKTSVFCPDDPINPRYESMKYYGIELPKNERSRKYTSQLELD